VTGFALVVVFYGPRVRVILSLSVACIDPNSSHSACVGWDRDGLSIAANLFVHHSSVDTTMLLLVDNFRILFTTSTHKLQLYSKSIFFRNVETVPVGGDFTLDNDIARMWDC